MQGMDRKYDGHAWCKLATTNIKKLFRLSFEKARYLSHLLCVHEIVKILCILKPSSVVGALIFRSQVK